MSAITRSQVNCKPASYVMTMTYLLNAHPIKVCTHAVANSANSSVNTNVKGQHFVPRQLTSDSYRPSADLLTANSQRGSQQEGQIKASLHFIFCKGNHFNDVCDKFTTLTA